MIFFCLLSILLKFRGIEARTRPHESRKPSKLNSLFQCLAFLSEGKKVTCESWKQQKIHTSRGKGRKNTNIRRKSESKKNVVSCRCGVVFVEAYVHEAREEKIYVRAFNIVKFLFLRIFEYSLSWARERTQSSTTSLQFFVVNMKSI